MRESEKKLGFFTFYWIIIFLFVIGSISVKKYCCVFFLISLCFLKNKTDLKNAPPTLISLFLKKIIKLLQYICSFLNHGQQSIIKFQICINFIFSFHRERRRSRTHSNERDSKNGRYSEKNDRHEKSDKDKYKDDKDRYSDRDRHEEKKEKRDKYDRDDKYKDREDKYSRDDKYKKSKYRDDEKVDRSKDRRR